MSDRTQPPRRPIPRMQSQNERDLEGAAARRERDQRDQHQREGVIKEFSNEEITGRYAGEELEFHRQQRPTDKRFLHLEKKHDELKHDVEKRHDELKLDVNEIRKDVKGLTSQISETRTSVAESMGDLKSEVSGAVGKIDGQAHVLTEVLGIVKKTADVDVERQQTQLQIARAKALADVASDKASSDVVRAQQLDTLDARKARRTLILKIVGLVGSGAGLVEILHRLGAL